MASSARAGGAREQTDSRGSAQCQAWPRRREAHSTRLDGTQALGENRDGERCDDARHYNRGARKQAVECCVSQCDEMRMFIQLVLSKSLTGAKTKELRL